ncbi:MAG: response regulator [Treponema sp.]|nr:response regulator [Treponema sp.]
MINSKDKKHILIISSEPRILAEIKSELMDHFDISIAATSTAALSAMEMDEISAIVICIYENRETAFSVFNDIFNSAKRKNIPIKFLSERGNDEDEITAFEIGAVDYSARRRGTTKALVDRIRLRINASEYEKNHFNRNIIRSGANKPVTILHNKTILVAEDVELNRDIIAAMLSEIDSLTVEFAVNGREAVEKFEKDPNLYTLILMDVQMPVMDGLKATKAIRRLTCENAREIPIIAATADVEEKEIKLCLEAGMNDYIEKPIVYDKIIAAADKHCRINKAGNQA